MISQTALVRRINRKLQGEECKLRRCNPSSRWFNDNGEWFIVDVRHNRIEATHQDLEQLGRELGVIQPGELVASE